MYVDPTILEEDWNAMGTWTDGDNNGSASSISPAGQLYGDCRSMSANGRCLRSKDFGTIGNGNYYIEIKFKGDVWDGFGDDNYGFALRTSAGIGELAFVLGNGLTDGDGIQMWDGADWVNVYTATWNTDWNIVVFYIHNNQIDADIWVNKDPRTEAADVTDADCSTASLGDGQVYFYCGYGTVAGNGEYHHDYYYIGSELLPAGTNMKINIGDVWKDVSEIKINIGDVWKDVTEIKQNIGDIWKTVF